MSLTQKRLIAFDKYAQHPWLGKAYKKLTSAERELAREFTLSHGNLDKGAFELAVNRMFLMREKPKHWTIILELLTCCNSAIES